MKIKAIVILLLSGLMSGCIGVMVAGAAGSLVVYDRRSITMIEKDARNFYVINRGMANDRRFRDSRILVTSYNQVVLLTGQATSALLKEKVEKIAQSAPRVRRVYNEVTIAEPVSMAQRSADTLITGKVRTQLLTKKGLESGSIRIVTEDSVVYLMGIVTHEQANLAVDAARQVQGVSKVVKIFQYIS